MELEDAFAAASTVQSSSGSAVIFGRKSSSSGGNVEANVPTLSPITELLDRRPLAVPATSSEIERGRQDKKDRNRSSSSKPSSTPVISKITTEFQAGCSKSPRSTRGSVKGSARESTPGRVFFDRKAKKPEDQDPEAALDRIIAEAGAGSTPDPLPMLDDRSRKFGQDQELKQADNSDIFGAVDLRTSNGKRDSSQHRGKDHENMVDIGETEEQQDVVKRSRTKEVCLECADSTRQKILDDAKISEPRNRLELPGQQATPHLIGQVNLLERHLEEKNRELSYAMTVEVPEWEAVTHDLTEKLEWQSEQSRRLEETSTTP